MALATAPGTVHGALIDEITALRRQRRAVILAHNYQRPEVQDIADYVGDSLGLSRQAAGTDAEVIVFCGVHFMAESAAILSPNKKVLLPDLEAGCSLADSITAAQLREWKAKHPGAVVVSYVNTSAEVKAESDYCCTSGNAEAVIRSIPEDKEILFCPDMFLGAYLEQRTGRKMHIWMGECHVHAGISAQDLELKRRNFPQAELLVHPECGCSTPTLYQMAKGDMPGPQVALASTEAMLQRAQTSNADTFIVATEVGILHRMQKAAPERRFIPASPEAVCGYMKKITLEKVRDSLQQLQPRVTVDEEVANRARLAIERMVAIAA